MGETTPFNSAAWLVDRHVSAGRGDRVAIRCQRRSTTYAELQTELWRAQHLLTDLGLVEGDRVAMVVQDDETFPAFFLGAQRSGLVPVPLSTMLKGPALGTIIADAEAQALVVSDTFAEAVSDIVTAAPSINSVVISGDPAASDRQVDWSLSGRSVTARHWQPRHLLAGDTETPEVPLAPTTADSQAFWLYSSGTTGTPKGVMHRHGNIPATVDTYASEVLQISEDDRCFSVAKLFFAYGLGNALTFPFAVGGTAILNPLPPSPAQVAEIIAEEKPTLFFSSPGFCAALLDLPNLDPDVFHTVRATVTAGESLPATIQTRFTQLSGSPVLDGIGSTELLHIFISNSLSEQVPGSSGREVPGYAAELRDDNNQVITAADTPGYLHVRGESAATGYWRKPDATDAAFQDGWVRTGDVYTRSSDGHWTFLGRNNDMIKAGGIWVSPAEVESVLIEHRSVLEAAVVGARDDDGLETVRAFVLPASGTAVDIDALQDHCRDRMAAFKRPREIVVVDQLPKTATGKIKRFELRNSITAT